MCIRDRYKLTIDGVQHTAMLWADPDTRMIWVASERGVYSFARPVAESDLDPGAAGADICAPMPGSLTQLLVEDGAEVVEGDAIAVVEAMKMEHVLRAPAAGTAHVKAAVGAQVALDEVLVTIVDEEAEED